MNLTDMLPVTMHHTPAPWEHGDNGLIYGQCGEDDVEAPFVCDVIKDSAMQALGILSPVEEANARLIAAAPELLEAIPPLIALVHRQLPHHAQSDSTLDNLSEVIRARAALAKAILPHLNQSERSMS
jgi:hypothetical protein